MATPQYPDMDDLIDHIESDSMEGWCTVCGAWTHDTCEPDAREYECPECHNLSCYGAEELLVMGDYV